MKFKNKLLILLFIFITLFTFLYMTNVKALTFDEVEFKEVPNDILDKVFNTNKYKSGDYYTIIGLCPKDKPQASSHPEIITEYAVLFVKKSLNIVPYLNGGIESGGIQLMFQGKDNTNTVRSFASDDIFYYGIGSDNNFWDYRSSTYNSYYFEFKLQDKTVYLWSDIDIRKNWNNNEPFFQPPVVEEPEPPILAPLLEVKEMEKANLQIRVIIPLIIVVVVSFLGLRKALQMLSTILRRS